MSKVCLVIIDGFGIAGDDGSSKDATESAANLKFLKIRYPFFKAKAHGEYVGLPPSTMGNSEVGHLTIGSGRIVKQNLLMINERIKTGEFRKRMDDLSDGFRSRIHLIGLLSDGGVHSHVDHLRFLLDYFKDREDVFVHAISDGRDTAQKCVGVWLNEFKDKIVSIAGRYYAMDRDKNFERIEEYFSALTEGKVKEFNIENLYTEGVTDEFIPPTLLKEVVVDKDDTLIFFNIRADRMKQIVGRFEKYPRKYTLTDYGCPDVTVIFENPRIRSTLAEWLSMNQIRQVHIAETEKYAHVTYFFNGGCESNHLLETHVLVNSPKTSSFDQKPGTSSVGVAEACLDSLKLGISFVLVNFASPDLVGHTGNYEKTCEAVSKVDSLIYNIYLECMSRGYALIITADHGNSEVMEKDGEICKTHTCNDVPLIIINSRKKLKDIKEVTLADISPTICDIFEIKIPPEMTGVSLIDNS